MNEIVKPARQPKASDTGEVLRSELLALEERVMFDAAAAVEVADTAPDIFLTDTTEGQDKHSDAGSLSTALGESPQTLRNEVYFIDGAVNDPADLIAAIPIGAEIVMLDGSQDGVEQIASVLEGRDSVEAIHIFAHGEEGLLFLGTATLDTTTIDGVYSESLSTIGQSLSTDGDILIYGCKFAGNEVGLHAAERLATATGADIAASDDLTGHADFGGDWELETKLGAIEVEEIEAVVWGGVLVDTDGDGVDDTVDIDGDNDGILDAAEKTITFTPLSDTATYSFAQDINGNLARHYPGAAELGAGGDDDPLNIVDGDINTELRLHDGDVFEYDLGQVVPAGTTVTLIEGPGGEDTPVAIYVSLESTDPNRDTLAALGTGEGTGYVNTITNSTLIIAPTTNLAPGASYGTTPSDASVTFVMPHDARFVQLIGDPGGEKHGGWAEIEFTTLTQTIEDLDSDGDGRPDHLDLDKDNDGITDNVEAQTTAGYVAPSGQGTAMVDLNGDGLDDNYAGGLTEVDTDGDGTVDTLDSDSDDDGVLDVAERGDGGPTATPTAPFSDADNDGLLDVFEGGENGDGYDVNDANIAGDDGGADGDYTNFTLADSDLDTNANEAVPGRTSNDAVAGTSDLDYRDNDPDTDLDGLQDSVDIDDDNDGILDVVEQTVTYVSLATSATVTTNEKFDGSSGDSNDLAFLIDGNSATEPEIRNGTVVEYDLGQTVLAGTQITFTEGTSGFDGTYEIYVSNGTQGPNVYANAVTGGGATLVASGTADVDLTITAPIEFTHLQIVVLTDKVGWVEMEFTSLSQVIETRDSDGDGRPDHLDLDKDNDGITDNVEAQTTAGYVAPSGQGTAMVDLNGDGLDDNYAGGLTEVDTDGDGTVDTLDSDSDDDGVLDVAERGDGGPTATPTAPFSDADNDGLLDVFEGGENGDGYDVNDANIAGDDGGADGDYTNFTLADSDLDTNANEAVPGRTSNDAVAGTSDLDYRDNDPDTDLDGLQDSVDIDDDNDGILDVVEQTVTYVSLATSATVTTNEKFDGSSGDSNDLAFLIDGNSATEPEIRNGTVVEYDLGQTVLAGTQITFTEGTSGFDGTYEIYVSNGTQGPNVYANAVTGGGATLVASGTADVDLTITAPIEFTHLQIVVLTDKVGWVEMEFTSLSQVIETRDSDGDGRPDHLDLDKDNDGITDNVEAQTTAGYVAPSGQGTAMVDLNGDGLDDNYAGGLTEVDTDGDGTVDTLDSDSDDDGVLDVAERGDGGPTATPTAPFSDADNDGLLDVFEGGENGDGYDVNDANIAGDDGGADGDYTNFTLADSDLDTNANEAVPGRTSNDAVAGTSDLDYRDTDVDTDLDGLQDSVDIDDDNDGILDVVEQTVTYSPLTVSMSYSYAQNTTGGLATHYGDQGTGGGDDPELIFDDDGTTELRMHVDDIIEYGFGQMVLAGTSITLAEDASGGEDEPIAIYVSFGTTDPDGDAAAISENGVGYQNAVTYGQSVLVYSGPSDANITFIVPTDATHIQFVGLGSHGGWAEIEFTTLTQTIEDLDSDGDGRPDHLDLDKDNDGITDNVEAQTTAGYVAPSGQGTAMVDLNGDGLDDNYAGGLTEVDTDGDGTVDTLDSDSDDDGVLDVAERGDGGPTATPTAPFSDADNDGLLDVFEGGENGDGYDVNDANIAGDDGGADGDYTNFTLADSDLDTNANEAVPGRTSNDAVAGTSDLDYRDNDPDTDLDGLQDSVDIDDDNDGILDVVEQTVTYVSLATSATVTTNEKFDGSSGDSNDLAFLIDGNSATEPEIRNGTVVEYDLGQTVLAGTQITFTEGTSGFDGTYEIYVSNGTQGPNVYANAVTGGGATLVASGTADVDLTITAPIEFTHLQIVVLTDKVGWVEMEFTSLSQVIETRDSDGDGRPDHLDLDKDNDGITDNVEAQTTAGYVAPSGQGTAMVDLNGDGLDDNYAGGLTEVDTDGDGTVDTLDSDSDDDGVLDVAERGDGGPTATPTAPFSDADNDGLLDVFEGGENGDGYDVNDANIAGDDGGADGDYTNFTLADSDLDTNANEAVPGRTSNDAVAGTSDLDYRDNDPDTDLDGLQDSVDIDDDNDGILDVVEQTVTYVSLATSATVTTNEKFDGSSGDSNDLAFLIDGNSATEPEIRNGTVVEYDLGQTVLAGTQITFTEGTSGFDGTYEIYVSNGTQGPNVYANAVTGGGATLVASGTADVDLTITAPIEFTHLQIVVLTDKVGWVEMEFTSLSQVIETRDSDGDGRPDHLDLDKDNDGITDNVEAQTTAGYVAPSGQGTAMVDLNGDGLDDNYAGGLTEVDTDGDGTVDTLDSDSDDDGVLDVAERGDGGPTATPTAPFSDADNDGLLDVFEGGENGDGYDVNDANIAGDDGGADGDYTNFTLADSDLDTNANEAVPGRTSNDAVAGTSDLDYRDNDPDTDLDGLQDSVDIDDDNDGILDVVEQTVTYVSLATSATVTTNEKFDGSSGDSNDLAFLIDGNSATEPEIRNGTVVEYDLGQTVLAGTQITFTEGTSGFDGTYEIYVSNGTQGPNVYANAVTGGGATLVASGTADVDLTITAPIEFTHLQIVVLTDKVGWVEMEFTSLSQVIETRDSDGDGRPDHLDLDKDNDGITDNVEAQTTAGYVAPSGQGTAMVDLNGDGLDDNYAGGLTEVDTDGDGTVDTLDSDSDDDGVLDVAERGDGGPTATPTAPFSDADNDGLLDVFEGGENGDGYDVNDANIAGDDGGADGDYTNFTLADSDLDTNANEAVPGRTSNDAVAGTSDLDYRDNDPDTDLDGLQDSVDIDDDNDGILDVVEQTVTYVSLATSATVTTNEKFDGSSGDSNDLAFLIDGNSATEPEIRNGTVVEYDLGQTVLAGTQITFTEGTSGFDGTYEIYVSNGTQGPNVYANAVTGGGATLVASGTADVDLTITAPIEFTHLQIVVLTDKVGWVEMEFTSLSQVIETRDSDGDGRPDHLDLDKDNDGITDNVEAQTTAGYVAPSGQGTAMVDLNGDGLDDNYAGGLTEVDTDGDGTVDTLDSDSDDDGVLDVAERGDGGPTATPTAPFSDADNDGLLDVFEGGENGDGYDVNDANIAGDDGGADGDYTNFTLADSDRDTNANVASVGRISNNAVPLDSDLDYRDDREDVIVNTPPTADDESFSTNEDTTSGAIDLLIGDTDPDGDTLSIQSIAGTSLTPGTAQTIAVTNGTVNVSSLGVVTFKPAANYNGPVNFDYVVVDGFGGSDTGTVFGTVDPVNDDFTDDNETVSVDEDAGPLTGNVIDGISVDGPITVTTFQVAGDATVYSAGDTATISGVGSLQIQDDGSYSFTPLPDYNGPVPVATYTLTDGSGTDDTSTLTITVDPVNDVPVVDIPVADQSAQDGETVSITGDFSDIDGDTLTYSVSGLPAGLSLNTTTGQISGTLDNSASQVDSGSGPGVYTITITASDSSLTVDDSFTYTVTNPAPTADDEINATAEDTTLTAGAGADNLLTGDVDPDADTLTITTFTVAGDLATYTAGDTATLTEGDLTINADGSYSFVSALNFNGAVPVATYTVDDGEGGTDEGTLTLSISPVNDLPVGVDDVLPVTEDVPVLANVLVNDTDADGDSLTISAAAIDTDGDGTAEALALGVPTALTDASGAPIGTITVASDGTVSFDPAPDYTGPVPDLVYTPTDGTADGSAATVTIGPIVPADDPLAITGLTDGAVPGTDGSVLESDLTDGTTAAGLGETLTGSFTISVADGVDTLDVGGTAISEAALVAATPGAPVSVTTPLGTLAITDFDPTTGVVSYTYTLSDAADHSGGAVSEDIALILTDDDGDTVAGTLSVAVIDDAPVANADTDEAVNTAGNPSSVATGNVVTGSDTVGGDPNTLDGVADAVGADNVASPVSGVVAGTGTPLAGNVGVPLTGSYGTLTLNGDGSYGYVPDYADPTVAALTPGVSVTDVFSYEITDADGDTATATLSVTIVGTPAVLGLGDGAVPGSDGTALESDLANGTNAGGGGDVLLGSFTLAAPKGIDTLEVGGTVIDEATLLATGTTPVTLTTAIGTLEIDGYDAATGTVNYTYTLTDDVDHSGGAVTDDFTVTLTDVDGDASSGSLSIAIGNDAPVAVADAASLGEDEAAPVTGNVVTGSDTVGADETTSPVTGVVAGTGTPTGGVGSAVPGSYGTLTLNGDGSYSYALDTADPAVQGLQSGESLTDIFTYEITDGDGDTATATLTLTIAGANDAPVAAADTASTPEDTPVAGNVLTNDSDPDGDPLIVTAASVDVDGNGSDDPLTLGAATPLTNASGDPIGTLTLGSDGAFSFVPALDYDGPVPQISYTVSDGQGGAAVATLDITLTPVNDVPVGVDDTLPVTEDTPASQNILVNDTDADGDSLTISAAAIDINGDGTAEALALGVPTALTDASGAPIGTITVASDGTVSFDPAPDYTGPVPDLVYTPTDGTADGSAATVTIGPISPVNDLPVGVDDVLPVTEDVPVLANVLVNDTDADGDSLTISAAAIDTDGDGTAEALALGVPTALTDASGAPIGTITVASDGTVSFDPAPDYTGPVPDLVYTPTDGTADGSAATVTIGPIVPADDPLAITGLTDGAVPGTDGSVLESDLTDGTTAAGLGETLTGSFTISVADGVDTLDVGGTAISEAALVAATPGAPVSVTTPLGTLAITDFDPTTGVVSYTYTLSDAADHSGGAVSEDIALILTDDDGDTVAGTLSVAVIDDAPVANADTDEAVNTAGNPSSVATGNVVTGSDTVGGDPNTLDGVADAVGADNVASPVSGVVAGTGTPLAGNVGVPLTGSYGTLTLNGDGSYGYVPDYADPTVAALTPGVSVTDVFSYEITDADGDTATATLSVTIVGTPAVLGLGDGAVPGSDGTALESDLANGTNAGGGGDVLLGSFTLAAPKGIDTLEVGGTVIDEATLLATGTTPVTLTTAIGTLEIDGYDAATGTVNYTYTLTDDVDHSGGAVTDDFTVTLTDVDGDASSGSLSIAIGNDAPVAVADAASLGEDEAAPVTGNVVTGSDTVGADETTSPVTGVVAGTGTPTGGVGSAVPGSYGTLTLNGDGSYSYALDTADPAVQGLQSGESLTDIFTYEITDGDGDTATATLTLTIAGANDAPVAAADTASTPEDTPVAGNVLTNDSDPDGDPLIVTAASVDVDGNGSDDPLTLGAATPLTNASGDPIGTLTLGSDGAFSFVPALDYDGPVPQISYTVSDGQGGAAVATLDITLTPVNDVPVGVDDTLPVTEDTPASQNILVNDTDADGDSLTISAAAIDINGDGTAEALALGVPTALTDASGAPIGTITVASDGTVSFDPAPDYTGPVPDLVYTPTDGTADGSAATVTIGPISPVNDLPVGVDDVLPVTEDVPVLANVLVNDTDADGDSLTISAAAIDTDGDGTAEALALGVPTALTDASGAPIGTITVASDGTVSFDPAPDYTGPVPDLVYTPTDGTADGSAATVTIGPIVPADDPLAITGLTDGAVPGTDGSVLESDLTDGTTAAGLGETLTGSFTISVADGVDTLDVGGTAISEAALVAATPGAPVSVTTPLGTLAITDFDPTTGVVSYTYTLSDAADHSGGAVSEDIALILTDDDGDTVAGTLSVAVIDDAPVANADTDEAVNTAGNPSSVATGNVVTGSDTVGGDPNTLDGVADAVGADNVASPVSGVVAGTGTPLAGNVGVPLTGSYGTLTLNGDGSYGYVPDYADPTVAALTPGVSVTDVFSYEITDADGDTATATLSVTIVGTPAVLGLGDGAVPGSDGTALESDLANGTNAGGGGDVLLGSFTLAAPKGIDTLEVGGTVIDEATLLATGTTPVTLTTAIGTLEIDGYDAATGTVNYTYTLTDDVDHSGGAVTDDFTVTLTDVDGDASSGSLSIAIGNDAPVAVADAASLGEDEAAPVTGNVVTGSDTVGADETTSPVTGVVAGTGTPTGGVGSAVPGSYGTLTLNGDGSYSYALDTADPAVQGLQSGESLTDIFTYEITDGDGDTATATLTLTIAGANDAPVAAADTASTPEDTPVAGNVLTNDSDPDGDPLIVTAASVDVDGNGSDDPLTLGAATPLTNASGDPIGTLTLGSDGAFSFVPALDYDGPVPQISYTVSDGQGGAAVATLDITLTPVNDVPVGVDDTLPVTEDTPASQNILVNDTDADGDSLTISAAAIDINGDGTAEALALGVPTALTDASGAPIGTITVASDGTVSFDPAPDYTGPVPDLVYTPTDGTADGSAATVTIGPISPVNDLPVGVDDVLPVTEDVPVLANVLVNDTDADGDSLTISAAAIDTDGDGTAEALALGVPTALTDASGAPIGTITVASDGTVSFDPAPDYTGPVPDLVYTPTDGTADGSAATVTIGPIVPADDPLAITGLTDGAVPGTDGSVLESDLTDGTTAAGLGETLTGSFTISVADGVDTLDVGGTAISEAALVAATPGAPVSVTTPLGTLAITDFDPTTGVVSYTYTLSDAADHSGGAVSEDIALILTDDDGDTVAGTLSVAVIDDAPVANADTDEAVNTAGNPSSVATGNVVTGSDTVGGDPNTLDGVADAVGADNVASPVSGVVAGTGTPLAGNVGVPLTGSYGTLTLNGDGSYGYVPDYADPTVAALTPGVSVTDVFSYEITDADGDTATATLSVTIVGTPAVLGLGDGAVPGSDGTALESDLANGTNAGGGGDVLLGSFTLAAPKGIDTLEVGGTVIDEATLLATGTTPVTLTTAIGTLEIDGYDAATGTVNYTYTLTDDVDHSGGAVTDDFTVTLTDVDGDASSGSLSIAIGNDAPVAVADAASLGEDEAAPVTGNVVTGSDTVGADETTSPVTGVVAGTGTPTGGVGSAVPGSYGTLTLNGDGSYSYALDTADPAVQGLQSGESLTDIFTYEITDGDGDTATATLTLTIAGANDAPVAAADTASTPEDTPVAGNVLTNDSDPDGDPLIVTAASVDVDGNGSDDPLTLGAATPLTNASGDPIGTLTLGSDGAFSFVPAPGFRGPVSPVTYTVFDGNSASTSSTLIITVTTADPSFPAEGSPFAMTERDTLRPPKLIVDHIVVETASASNDLFGTPALLSEANTSLGVRHPILTAINALQSLDSTSELSTLSQNVFGGIAADGPVTEAVRSIGFDPIHEQYRTFNRDFPDGLHLDRSQALVGAPNDSIISSVLVATRVGSVAVFTLVETEDGSEIRMEMPAIAAENLQIMSASLTGSDTVHCELSEGMIHVRLKALEASGDLQLEIDLSSGARIAFAIEVGTSEAGKIWATEQVANTFSAGAEQFAYAGETETARLKHALKWGAL